MHISTHRYIAVNHLWALFIPLKISDKTSGNLANVTVSLFQQQHTGFHEAENTREKEPVQ